MSKENNDILIKSVELAGLKVELLSENRGATFRVNVVDDENHTRTRVFSNYVDASIFFNVTVEGN